MYITVIPPFEGYDEPWHYAYVQEICEHRRLPDFHSSKLSMELEKAFTCLPTSFKEDPLPRHETYWQLPSRKREQMRQALEEIPREYRIKDSTIDQYQAQHPPLYYMLCAPVYLMTQDEDLINRLFAMRMFSVLLASFTLPLGYLAIRSWFPGNPMVAFLAVVIIVFTPSFYFDTSRVGNDSLGVPLFTALLWACGAFWTGGWKPSRSLAVGILLGLGLLTKAYFLAALPPLLLLLMMKWRFHPTRKRTLVFHVVLLFICLVGMGGWWYCRNLVLYGAFSGLVESVYSNGQENLSWIYAFKEMSIPRFLRRVVDSHFWPGPWSSPDLPILMSWFFRVILSAGLFAFLGKTILGLYRNPKEARNVAPVMVLVFYLSFFAAMLFHSLQAWQLTGCIMTGGHYLCTMIAIETAMLLMGLRFILAGRLKNFPVDLVLLVLFITVDLWGILIRMIPYYTGFAKNGEHGGLIFEPVSTDLWQFMATVLDRMAWNRPSWLTGMVFAILLSLCILAALCSVVYRMVSHRMEDQDSPMTWM